MALNILHLHSSFDLGGKEARAVRLMNAFGDRAKHTIVSGVEGAYGARDAIARGIRYEIAQNPPPLTGKPSVARYEAIARYMARFDLVLTYNSVASSNYPIPVAAASSGVPAAFLARSGCSE